MRKYNNPARDKWQGLCKRPVTPQAEFDELMVGLFEDITSQGDEALRRYTKRYDKVVVVELVVELRSIEKEARAVAPPLRKAVDTAFENIRLFHAAQRGSLPARFMETQPGVVCWREARAIESVGLYVPGGTAPLISTALMLGIPAQLAGCTQIVMCTPPDKQGNINPAIRYVAAKVGVTKLLRVGGAQAIAAMTVGTESVPKVSKIFGPGNQYVTAAKAYAQQKGVAMDMPAGPSEVLVIADKAANPAFVAADLLSQAEHGVDSQVVLLTDSQEMLVAVQRELDSQLAQLPKRDIAKQALEESRSICFESLDMAMDFANVYAPEHLILNIEDPSRLARLVVNAGSVFLGRYTPESAGDYASGTNHTLPTNGWARSYGGVSLDSFVKQITFQSITKAGLAGLAQTIEILADAEGLQAHARAVSIRVVAK